MELIPEWAPNLHPMIVHFPVALLLAAIAVDGLAVGLRRWDWLRTDWTEEGSRRLSWIPPATVALYVTGGASAVLTYFTGTWAAEAVSVPAAAEPVLSEHANLGWWTMWFFGLYALLRLGAHLWPRTGSRMDLHVLLFLIALGGGYLLYETGDHGAQLVFRHGVGVQRSQEKATTDELGLTVGENGWQWQPQSDTSWTGRMTWLEGRPSDVSAVLDTTEAGRIALALRPSAPVAFVVPDTLGAVQLTAELNWDAFDGTVALLHHVQGPSAYDFLAVEAGTLRQGRVAQGDRSTFATGKATMEGWRSIRVVGDATHFRGYVDGTMVVHGHGDAAAPGSVGLRLEGRGTVRLRSLQARGL